MVRRVQFACCVALAAFIALIVPRTAFAVCGDANGNGSVTVTDGVAVLRAAAGLPTACPVVACDVDQSGPVTVTDGVQVLREAAGLPNTCHPEWAFLDSGVAGLSFTAGAISAITVAHGGFAANVGDDVTFSVGGIVLGHAPATRTMSPLVLGTNDAATNIARLLQTIDDDGIAANGIRITETVRSAAQTMSVNFAQSPAAFGGDPGAARVVAGLTALTSAGQRLLVGPDQAQEHLEKTLLDAGILSSAGLCATETCIRIPEMWSQQFPGSRANLLPGDAGVAGSIEQVQRVLMGARDDGRAYAGAIVELLGSVTYADTLKVRFLRKTSPRSCPASATEFGPQTIVPLGSGEIGSAAEVIAGPRPGMHLAHIDVAALDTDDIPNEYHVVAWLDRDDDGRVGAGEPFAVSFGCFSVVTSGQYTHARNFLGLFASSPFNPRASELIRAFLDRAPIRSDGTAYPASQLSYTALDSDLQSSLSYKVGLDFSETKDGAARSFFLPVDSALATDIRASPEFREAVTEAIADGGPDAPQRQVSLEIRYEGDQDLHYAIGGDENGGGGMLDLLLTPSVECIGGRKVATGALCSGSLIDLYDFNYCTPGTDTCKADAGGLGQQAAIVQAGFGTLGNSGQIYRLEVRVDDVLVDLDVDLGPCETPTPTPVPTPARTVTPPPHVDPTPNGGSIHLEANLLSRFKIELTWTATNPPGLFVWAVILCGEDDTKCRPPFHYPLIPYATSERRAIIITDPEEPFYPTECFRLDALDKKNATQSYGSSLAFSNVACVATEE